MDKTFFVHKMIRRAFTWELRNARQLGYSPCDAYLSAMTAMDQTYDLVMGEDRPAVLTRFRR